MVGAQVFVWKEDLDAAANEVPVDEFDIQPLFYEPGQKSYMREHVAYEVLKYVLALTQTTACIHTDS